MRVLSQTELNRLTRTELMVLLQRMAGELANLPENSTELRNAHANLVNIRRALRGQRRRHVRSARTSAPCRNTKCVFGHPALCHHIENDLIHVIVGRASIATKSTHRLPGMDRISKEERS
jgi:hypothetical protein